MNRLKTSEDRKRVERLLLENKPKATIARLAGVGRQYVSEVAKQLDQQRGKRLN